MAAGRKTGGRQKGTPNKVTRDIRQAVLDAVEALGADGEGTDGLRGWLMQLGGHKPEKLADLLGKIMPTQVTGEGGGPLSGEVRVTIVDAGSDARHPAATPPAGPDA